eukprot:1194348-Prorocentrum_minimum.AAC.2
MHKKEKIREFTENADRVEPLQLTVSLSDCTAVYDCAGGGDSGGRGGGSGADHVRPAGVNLPPLVARNSLLSVLDAPPVVLNAPPVVLNAPPVVLNAPPPVVLNAPPVVLNAPPVLLKGYSEQSLEGAVRELREAVRAGVHEETLRREEAVLGAKADLKLKIQGVKDDALLQRGSRADLKLKIQGVKDDALLQSTITGTICLDSGGLLQVLNASTSIKQHFDDLSARVEVDVNAVKKEQHQVISPSLALLSPFPRP